MSESKNPLAALSAMSSQTHKKRGSCCKSACLHCPYGFTLKRFGLQFSDVSASNIDSAKALTGLDLSLESEEIKNYKFVLLKETECALIRVNHLFVLDLYLKEEFTGQGLDKPTIESYYFY